MNSNNSNPTFVPFGANLADNTASADLTPMLDTIFLIILLLLSTLINSTIVRGFEVSLPAVNGEMAVQKEQDRIEISVDQTGQVYIGKEIISPNALATTLSDQARQSPDARIFLRADDSANYGRVAQVLNLISRHMPGHPLVIIAEQAAHPTATTQPRKESDQS